jgi:hypothetical protein
LHKILHITVHRQEIERASDLYSNSYRLNIFTLFPLCPEVLSSAKRHNLRNFNPFLATSGIGVLAFLLRINLLFKIRRNMSYHVLPWGLSENAYSKPLSNTDLLKQNEMTTIIFQNYWIFLLFPSSGILENRKHDVSETGSVSVLK